MTDIMQYGMMNAPAKKKLALQDYHMFDLMKYELSTKKQPYNKHNNRRQKTERNVIVLQNSP